MIVKLYYISHRVGQGEPYGREKIREKIEKRKEVGASHRLKKYIQHGRAGACSC